MLHLAHDNNSSAGKDERTSKTSSGSTHIVKEEMRGEKFGEAGRNAWCGVLSKRVVTRAHLKGAKGSEESVQEGCRYAMEPVKRAREKCARQRPVCCKRADTPDTVREPLR